MYVSELLGTSLTNAEGGRAGRIDDLMATIDGAAPPLVVGLVQRKERQDYFLPLSLLAAPDLGNPLVVRADITWTLYERGPQQVLLGRDVMDNQVIDLRVPRVVRVNDVLLEPSVDGWQVSGVDVGAGALVRRILPRALRRPSSEQSFLRWPDLELLASEVPGGLLRADHARLSRMHPADIARIADAVSKRQAIEIVSALSDDLAADAMEEMIDQKQAEVIEALDPERAADILERMAPDAAADVLAELDPGIVDDVLRRMVPNDAADIHALLTYPKQTAGGLMTTDYVVAPGSLRVSAAADYLREQMIKPDWVYYVYVVEDVENRTLKGILSLRELFLARPEQRLDEIMEHVVRSVTPEETSERVAQIMSEYNLLALPVLDKQGQLLGIVSVDDALEVVLPDELRRRIPRVFS